MSCDLFISLSSGPTMWRMFTNLRNLSKDSKNEYRRRSKGQFGTPSCYQRCSQDKGRSLLSKRSRENAENTTSYLGLASRMEGESMRAMHNWPVLLKLASAFNDSIVREADIHSSECTSAQQTPIVSSEWLKKGLDEWLFFHTETATMNIYLGCRLWQDAVLLCQ